MVANHWQVLSWKKPDQIFLIEKLFCSLNTGELFWSGSLQSMHTLKQPCLMDCSWHWPWHHWQLCGCLPEWKSRNNFQQSGKPNHPKLCHLFSDTEWSRGDAAKAQVAMNPTNMGFDVKHLIECKFDGATVQSDIKHWFFMVANDAGRLKIQVE